MQPNTTTRLRPPALQWPALVTGLCAMLLVIALLPVSADAARKPKTMPPVAEPQPDAPPADDLAPPADDQAAPVAERDQRQAAARAAAPDDGSAAERPCHQARCCSEAARGGEP